MMVLLLRDAGIKVIDRSPLGRPDEVREELLSSTISMYAEYTGRGAFFFEEPDLDVWKDPRKAFARIRELDATNHDVMWLSPAPANNTLAIAIPEALAADEGLRTLKDFADYVNRGGRVKLAGSEEFLSAQDGLAAFETTYGFALRADQVLRLEGSDTARAEKAAADGTEGANAALAFGTDGSLAALDLVVLEDPLHAQLALEPAPAVMGTIMAEYPQIVDIFGPLFNSLNLRTLQQLNAQVDVEGREAAEVAVEYLVSKGFLE